MDKREIIVEKLKMYDVGSSYDAMMEVSPKKTENKLYPSLCLDNEKAPFLEKMSVGDKCEIMCEVELVSHSMHKSSYGDAKGKYVLEIKKIGKLY